MNLTPYVDSLRNDLAVAAEAGGADARALAERLVAPLESAVRLVLLDALSEAVGEITRDLAPGSVDLRLRDREPSFVVSLPPGERMSEHHDEPDPMPSARPPAEADDATMVRINLRLSQDLKDRVEDAAREAGLSVNAWLVRSATAGLEPDGGRRHDRREVGGGARYRGWVR